MDVLAILRLLMAENPLNTVMPADTENPWFNDVVVTYVFVSGSMDLPHL